MSTMVKPKSQKDWQQRNPDKVRAYTARYQEGKKKISVILTKKLVEKIDTIKAPSKTYGRWVRELVEQYINNMK